MFRSPINLDHLIDIEGLVIHEESSEFKDSTKPFLTIDSKKMSSSRASPDKNPLSMSNPFLSEER